ncbi:hypothetical protein FQN54_003423 [Arachnomyces sp. PD_36]|nr:hypothetical protein FQN54_003423 [Arachnomyces sp. PD_36]
MATQNESNTVFMTPAEAERVRKTIQDRIQKCRESTGQPREPGDPKTLASQATSTSLMSDIDFGMGDKKSEPDTMVAFPVGCGYPPCTASLEDLEPMKLSDLRIETHHRGRVLSVRRVSPVVELVASSWTVVQDDTSDGAERLDVFLHKSKHGKDVLELGSEFLVKEPYFTLNNQGEPAIRIDHPSDLVVSVDNDDPESWRKATKDDTPARAVKTAVEYKEEGNAALKKQALLRAHASYTEGLKLVSKENTENGSLLNDLFRNRSYVNLLLQRHDEAKTDALASLTRLQDETHQSLDGKAYSRAGHAAYGLGQFEEAKGLFEEQLKLQPDDREAKINVRRVKLRLNEQSTGGYDFQKIVGSLAKTRRRADAASFHGYTEVKESPGAGRGLFATRDIESGEVIMCEKAFCVVWGQEAEAWSALACDLREDAAIRVFPAGLLKAIVQKLRNNPSHAEKVLDLYGDYQGLGKEPLRKDGDSVIDVFQVHDIVQRNAFGPGPAQPGEEEHVSSASTGLWVQAAYINHSCFSNARKDYIGDLMVLRATRKIAAGDEITHTYDETSDYDARAATLKSTWGFKCSCTLCAAEEADGPDLRKKRRGLEDQVNAFVQREYAPQAKKISIVKAKRLRRLINESYDDKRYSGLPRRSLSTIEQWLKAAPSS